ncbi:MAG: hypothetical protein C6I01_06525 [Epsilonproteobacteria bacterium]|nr:hypothetical protein [Campylobacterota bacterium]
MQRFPILRIWGLLENFPRGENNLNIFKFYFSGKILEAIFSKFPLFLFFYSSPKFYLELYNFLFQAFGKFFI